MPKPWRTAQRQARTAASEAAPVVAEADLTTAAQALQDSWQPSVPPAVAIELQVRLGPGDSIILRTHTGREVMLLPTENGMWHLRDYLRYATRAAQGLPAVAEPAIATPRVLANYHRVCHCNRPADAPERCIGCPGPTGAGKLRSFTSRGRETIPLDEL